MKVFIHDPEAVLDYDQDWSAWLRTGDTILSADAVASDDDITITAVEHTTTTTKVWVSGGTLLSKYFVTVHVETADGREDDRTFALLVREK